MEAFWRTRGSAGFSALRPSRLHLKCLQPCSSAEASDFQTLDRSHGEAIQIPSTSSSSLSTPPDGPSPGFGRGAMHQGFLAAQSVHSASFMGSLDEVLLISSCMANRIRLLGFYVWVRQAAKTEVGPFLQDVGHQVVGVGTSFQLACVEEACLYATKRGPQRTGFPPDAVCKRSCSAPWQN